MACYSLEEVRDAVRRLRGERKLRVQALQGQRHRRVVSDARPGVRQPLPLPYLRRDQVSHLRQVFSVLWSLLLQPLLVLLLNSCDYDTDVC